MKLCKKMRSLQSTTMLKTATKKNINKLRKMREKQTERKMNRNVTYRDEKQYKNVNKTKT